MFGRQWRIEALSLRQQLLEEQTRRLNLQAEIDSLAEEKKNLIDDLVRLQKREESVKDFGDGILEALAVLTEFSEKMDAALDLLPEDLQPEPLNPEEED